MWRKYLPPPPPAARTGRRFRRQAILIRGLRLPVGPSATRSRVAVVHQRRHAAPLLCRPQLRLQAGGGGRRGLQRPVVMAPIVVIDDDVDHGVQNLSRFRECTRLSAQRPAPHPKVEIHSLDVTGRLPVRIGVSG